MRYEVEIGLVRVFEDPVIIKISGGRRKKRIAKKNFNRKLNYLFFGREKNVFEITYVHIIKLIKIALYLYNNIKYGFNK